MKFIAGYSSTPARATAEYKSLEKMVETERREAKFESFHYYDPICTPQKPSRSASQRTKSTSFCLPSFSHYHHTLARNLVRHPAVGKEKSRLGGRQKCREPAEAPSQCRARGIASVPFACLRAIPHTHPRRSGPPDKRKRSSQQQTSKCVLLAKDATPSKPSPS